MRLALSLVFSLFAVAASANETGHGQDDHHDEEHAESEHKATLNDVTLLHAWAAETEGSEVFVYMEIDNEGTDPVTLLGAEAGIAEAVELVGFQSRDGTASYTSLPMLPIAAGAEMVLAPNAVAFRMTGVTTHLHEGDAFEIQVVFDAGKVAMMAQVEAQGATQHGHAGHNH